MGPSERPAAVLLGFWAAFEATSWGSRWGAEPLAARLPLTTQLDFEPVKDATKIIEDDRRLSASFWPGIFRISAKNLPLWSLRLLPTVPM